MHLWLSLIRRASPRKPWQGIPLATNLHVGRQTCRETAIHLKLFAIVSGRLDALPPCPKIGAIIRAVMLAATDWMGWIASVPRSEPRVCSVPFGGVVAHLGRRRAGGGEGRGRR